MSKRCLEVAAREAGRTPAVAWHAFLLHPEFPRAPHDFEAAFVAKYGQGARVPVWDDVMARGEAVGIRFRFYEIEHGFNSVDAHRLVRLAGRIGEEDAMIERLFSAFFEECRYLGDLELLADLGAEAGLDRADTLARLRSEEGLPAIYEAGEAARRDPGVSGVPFHLVDSAPWRPGDTSLAAYRGLLAR